MSVLVNSRNIPKFHFFYSFNEQYFGIVTNNNRYQEIKKVAKHSIAEYLLTKVESPNISGVIS